ncbi:MAG TPA: flippase [Dongiaceae bacterium]|nr:flippase [Dongiaceae bacterium]
MPLPSASAENPPTRTKRPSIARNVVSNWGAYALAMMVNFFLSPYVVRHLGNTGYGVWTLILSLTGYLGLLDLGVRGAVTRYVAKFHTQLNHKQSSNVASSALVIFATAGILAILVSILMAVFVVPRVHIPEQFQSAARIVVIVTGLSVAASLVNGVFGGILVGLQRFDLSNLIEMTNNLLRAGTIVVALRLGYGIVTLAFIQLGFTLVRLAANLTLSNKLYPELQLRLTEVDRAGIRLIFSFSFFSFLLHVSGSLIYATDNVVIGSFLPVAAVTFYVIGGNLADYTRALVSGISQTMTPVASSTEAGHNQSELQRIVLLSSRAGSMVMLPVAITFLLRGSTFIGLWMGPQYAELSGKVLRILSLTLILWAANAVTAGSVLGVSKHRPLVPVLLGEGITNLILSIILIRKMGILGVAWGTVIPGFCSSVLFWPWYIRRTFGIKIAKYAESSWVRPWLGAIPFVIGSYLFEHYWQANNLVVFFAQVLIALPLAPIGYWLVCLDSEERTRYYQTLIRSVGRMFAGRLTT